MEGAPALPPHRSSADGVGFFSSGPVTSAVAGPLSVHGEDTMRESPQSEKRFFTVGDGSGLEREDRFHRQELQLALRNRG
jgi:hypothetical protein